MTNSSVTYIIKGILKKGIEIKPTASNRKRRNIVKIVILRICPISTHSSFHYPILRRFLQRPNRNPRTVQNTKTLQRISAPQAGHRNPLQKAFQNDVVEHRVRYKVDKAAGECRVDGYQFVGAMDIFQSEINRSLDISSRDIARSNRLGLVPYSDATRTLLIICNGVLFRP